MSGALRLCNCLSERGDEIVGVKPKRAGLALVGYTAAGQDEVKPVRPTGVGAFNLVIEAVDYCGKLDAEPSHTRVGHGHALLLVAGAAEEHLVADVALHRPHV